MKRALLSLHRFARDDGAKLPFAGAAVLILIVSSLSGATMTNIVEKDLTGRADQAVQDVADLVQTELNEQARALARLALVWSMQTALARPIEDTQPLPKLTTDNEPDLAVAAALTNTLMDTYVQTVFPREIGTVRIGVSNVSIAMAIADVLVEDVTIDTKGIDWASDLELIREAETAIEAQVKEMHKEFNDSVVRRCGKLPGSATDTKGLDVARQQCETYKTVAARSLDNALDNARFSPNLSIVKEAPGFEGPGIIAPRPGKNFYHVTGHAEVTVEEVVGPRRVSSTAQIDAMVLDQTPFMLAKAQSFERVASGPNSEVNKLATYILVTLAQWRVINGYGATLPDAVIERIAGMGGSYTSLSARLDAARKGMATVITAEEVTRATTIALDLSSARYFRAIPEGAHPMAKTILEKYAQTRTLDAADVLLLMQENAGNPADGNAKVDLQIYLGQALYLIADQVVFGAIDIHECTERARAKATSTDPQKKIIDFWSQFSVCMDDPKICEPIPVEERARCNRWRVKLGEGARKQEVVFRCLYRPHEWEDREMFKLCREYFGIEGLPGVAGLLPNDFTRGGAASRSAVLQSWFFGRNCQTDYYVMHTRDQPVPLDRGLGLISTGDTPNGKRICLGLTPRCCDRDDDDWGRWGGNNGQWALGMFYHRWDPTSSSEPSLSVSLALREAEIANKLLSTQRTTTACRASNGQESWSEVTWTYGANYDRSKIPSYETLFASKRVMDIYETRIYENIESGETVPSVFPQASVGGSPYGALWNFPYPDDLWNKMADAQARKYASDGIDLSSAAASMMLVVASDSKFFERAGVSRTLQIPINTTDTDNAMEDFQTEAMKTLRALKSYYANHSDELRKDLTDADMLAAMVSANERPNEVYAQWHNDSWGTFIDKALGDQITSSWKAQGKDKARSWLDHTFEPQISSTNSRPISKPEGASCDAHPWVGADNPAFLSSEPLRAAKDHVADQMSQYVEVNLKPALKADSVRKRENEAFNDTLRQNLEPPRRYDAAGIRAGASLAFSSRINTNLVYQGPVYEAFSEIVADAFNADTMFEYTVFAMETMTDGYKDLVNLRNLEYRIPMSHKTPATPDAPGFKFYGMQNREGPQDHGAPPLPPADDTRVRKAPAYDPGDVTTVWERTRQNSIANSSFTFAALYDYPADKAKSAYLQATERRDSYDPATYSHYDLATMRKIAPIATWDTATVTTKVLNTDNGKGICITPLESTTRTVIRAFDQRSWKWEEPAKGGDGPLLLDARTGLPVIHVAHKDCDGKWKSSQYIVDPDSCAPLDPATRRPFKFNNSDSLHESQRADGRNMYEPCGRLGDFSTRAKPGGDWNGTDVVTITADGTKDDKPCASIAHTAQRRQFLDVANRDWKGWNRSVRHDAEHDLPILDVEIRDCHDGKNKTVALVVDPATCSPLRYDNKASYQLHGNASLRQYTLPTLNRTMGHECDAIRSWDQRGSVDATVRERIEAHRGVLVEERKGVWMNETQSANPPKHQYVRAFNKFMANLDAGLDLSAHVADCKNLVAKNCTRAKIKDNFTLLDRATGYPLKTESIYNVEDMFRIHEEGMLTPDASKREGGTQVSFTTKRESLNLPTAKLTEIEGWRFAGDNYSSTPFQTTWKFSLEGEAAYRITTVSNDLVLGDKPLERFNVTQVPIKLQIAVTTVSPWGLHGIVYKGVEDFWDKAKAAGAEEEKRNAAKNDGKRLTAALMEALGPLMDFLDMIAQIIQSVAEVIGEIIAGLQELMRQIFEVIMRALVYVVAWIIQLFLDLLCWILPSTISFSLFGVSISIWLANCESDDWGNAAIPNYGRTPDGRGATAHPTARISLGGGFGELSFTLYKFRDHERPISAYLAGAFGIEGEAATVPVTWALEGKINPSGDEEHPWRFGLDIAAVSTSYGMAAYENSVTADGGTEAITEDTKDTSWPPPESGLKHQGLPSGLWLYHRFNTMADGRFLELRVTAVTAEPKSLSLSKELSVGPLKGAVSFSAEDASRVLAAEKNLTEVLPDISGAIEKAAIDMLICLDYAAYEGSVFDDTEQSAVTASDCIPGPETIGNMLEEAFRNALESLDDQAIAALSQFDSMSISLTIEKEGKPSANPKKAMKQAGQGISIELAMENPGESFPLFAKWAIDGIGDLIEGSSGGDAGGAEWDKLKFLDDVWLRIYAYKMLPSIPHAELAQGSVNSLKPFQLPDNYGLHIGANLPALMQRNDATQIYSLGIKMDFSADIYPDNAEKKFKDVLSPAISKAGKAAGAKGRVAAYAVNKELNKREGELGGSWMARAFDPSESRTFWLLKVDAAVVYPAKSREALLWTYAPWLQMHPDERYQPTSVDDYLPHVGVRTPGSLNDHLSMLDTGKTVYHPIPPEREWVGIRAYQDPENWMKLDDAAFRDPPLAARSARPADMPIAKVYGRIVDGELSFHLQYFILYPRNEWATGRTAEGDWETIDIMFTKPLTFSATGGDPSKPPDWIAFSSHRDDAAYGMTTGTAADRYVRGERWAWSDITKSTTHPILGVALGSHAMSRNTADVTWGNGVIDRYGNGPRYEQAQITETTRDQIEWNNYVIEVLPKLANKLEKNDTRPDVPWLLYQGRWGDVTDPMDKTRAKGSRGPAFLDHNLAWEQTQTWALTMARRTA